MNSKCENTECIYNKTCLISEPEKLKRCTGKLSKINPDHPDYKMQVRGNN